jgi:hypothetical protein
MRQLQFFAYFCCHLTIIKDDDIRTGINQRTASDGISQDDSEMALK